MKEEKGGSSWPGEGLPCRWTGRRRRKRKRRRRGRSHRLGYRETKSFNITSEHHKLKDVPVNWEWTDWLLWQRKGGTGCFQCKQGNKRSVEVVIEAQRFKGLQRLLSAPPQQPGRTTGPFFRPGSEWMEPARGSSDVSEQHEQLYNNSVEKR